MELFIVDAFTNRVFEGNQAGVVLLNDQEAFPEASVMQKIASELKHSETAFVKAMDQHTFALKYFTPVGEVDLCGHATVSAFTVLRNEKKLRNGDYTASTLAGNLNVIVEKELIWLEMVKGKGMKYLTDEESEQLYRAYNLALSDQPAAMRPCIVNTGLSDILMPVKSKARLDHAVQKREEVVRISKNLQVVGVHMFCYTPNSQATAFCRNFAPLYGIDEESATGTSNASLTHYLLIHREIQKDSKNTFVQGESMGKPSVIFSKISEDGEIYIGGNAVISIKASLTFTGQTDEL